MAAIINEANIRHEKAEATGKPMEGISKRVAAASAIVAAWVVLISPLEARYRSLGNPVDMPISLRTGDVKRTDFTAKNGPYDIIIRVKKNLPVAQIDCLLGIHYTEPDCGRPPAVVVNWKLWSEGKIVDSGPPTDYRHGGSWSSGYVGLFLGGFIGKKGKAYNLEITVVGDGSALDVTDPHLVVQFSDYD